MKTNDHRGKLTISAKYGEMNANVRRLVKLSHLGKENGENEGFFSLPRPDMEINK